MLSLIVAVTRNGVIGKDNQLLWRLRADMRRFRALTMGKPIIMGRKTFLSIGKPLDGRDNIIISTRPDFQVEGAFVCHTVEDALALGEARAALSGGGEVMVIGGEMIYRATLPKADRLYLSLVEAELEGDAFFPLPESQEWRLVETTFFPADKDNDYAHHYQIYARV